jgi:hypothetical protein
MSGDDHWYDEAAGPLVRPYAMVRGRTRPQNLGLDLVTQVRTARALSDPSGWSVEHLEIIELCRRPLSVAEVAAYLDAPLMVVKVLLSDLIQRGDILARSPAQVVTMPDRNLLQAVLDGVRGI